MSITIKNPSPLIEAVLSLDNHLAEIERLGLKIEELVTRSHVLIQILRDIFKIKYSFISS